jgi:hypothetical protein
MASRKTGPVATRTLEAEMRRVGKRLDCLVLAARTAEADVRARSMQELRKLRRKQAVAQRALEKLARRSAAASGPLNAGLRKAWRDIEAALRQAKRRFRGTD